MKYHNVIAMDGPAASGKSTIGRMLADELDYLFLDTGCMYRAVTLAALENNVDVGNETAVSQLANNLNLDIQPAGEIGDGRHYSVFINERDVTWDIRRPDVDANVSAVSSYLAVRQEMVRRQREYGQRGNVVMVGRDIGTVVMPEAPTKLYITATAEERARRRLVDREQQGHADAFAATLADVELRDKLDSSRQHSPMRPASDAIIIDTTNRAPESIIAEIVDLLVEPSL